MPDMSVGTAAYGDPLTPVQRSAVEVLRFFDCTTRDQVLDLLARWNGRVLLGGDDVRVICDHLTGWTRDPEPSITQPLPAGAS
jgi:hypothetical protein